MGGGEDLVSVIFEIELRDGDGDGKQGGREEGGWNVCVFFCFNIIQYN